jgi:transposase
MLSQQQEYVLSKYSALYDMVVPQDNLLRRINGLIDFSFVYQELLDKYCSDNGRMAESPIRMFKYLLLKVFIYDISDVDVVEHSRHDMSFKYFLGMAPKADVINPSSLCQFRKLRLKDMDLLNLLIKKTVDIAMEKGIISSRTIIVDATHTSSRSNPYSPIEILRLRSKQLRKDIYNAYEAIKDALPKKNGDDDLVKELGYTKELLDIASGNAGIAEVPAVKQRIHMQRETLEDIEDHCTTSKDEDARVGHKSEESSFFGYKTHIAMSDERIITAAVITSGEKGDGP